MPLPLVTLLPLGRASSPLAGLRGLGLPPLRITGLIATRLQLDCNLKIC
jgi:hypothetical protein